MSWSQIVLQSNAVLCFYPYSDLTTKFPNNCPRDALFFTFWYRTFAYNDTVYVSNSSKSIENWIPSSEKVVDSENVLT